MDRGNDSKLWCETESRVVEQTIHGGKHCDVRFSAGKGGVLVAISIGHGCHPLASSRSRDSSLVSRMLLCSEQTRFVRLTLRPRAAPTVGFGERLLHISEHC